MKDRNEIALNLSEEILEDFEYKRLPIADILLKCLRLARIVEDAENIKWLRLEVSGYKSMNGGIPEEDFEIAFLHSRGNIDKKGVKTIFPGAIEQLEKNIESAKNNLQSFSTNGASVSGDHAAIAMNALTNSVARNTQDLRTTISNNQSNLARLKAEYYNYVLNINMQLKFSDKVETIFNEYRIEVDAFLVELIPNSANKLSNIYSRLQEDNVDSWSQASNTCRKLIVEFTDSLFEKIFINNVDKKKKLKSGKEIDVTGDNYLNRLYVILDKIGVNEMKENNIKQTADWIETVNNRVCKGVHKDLNYDEIRNIVLHMYLMMADIINDYKLYIKDVSIK